MTIQDELSSIVEAFAAGNLPTAKQVSAMLQDPEILRRLLAVPALADALAQRAAKKSGLSCLEVDEDLASFIDRERLGGTLHPAYRQLALHLKLCPWCADGYSLTWKAIAAQAGGTLPRWPNQQLGQPLKNVSEPVVLNRRLLARLLEETHDAEAIRAAGPNDGSHLLYADAVPGDPTLFIRIVLVKPTQFSGNICQLRVLLQGSPDLADRLVVLACGGEQYEVSTDAAGEACFVNLPLAWFMDEALPDLLVTVGAR